MQCCLAFFRSTRSSCVRCNRRNTQISMDILGAGHVVSVWRGSCIKIPAPRPKTTENSLRKKFTSFWGIFFRFFGGIKNNFPIIIVMLIFSLRYKLRSRRKKNMFLDYWGSFTKKNEFMHKMAQGFGDLVSTYLIKFG